MEQIKNIFITGITGLVGSTLAFDLLNNNSSIKIKALIRKTSNTSTVLDVFNFYNADKAEAYFKQITFVYGDILDYPLLLDELQYIDEAYHTAALVSFNKNDKEKLFNINVNGTKNIVNACLENKVKKLAYISSTATIGKDKKGNLCSETTEWAPDDSTTNYALSKYNAELEVFRGYYEGLNTVIINPSVIIGPGDWSRSSITIFRTVAKGIKFYTNGGNAFVDVRDVSIVLRKLMEENIFGERFLVFNENLSFKTLFTFIANSLNKKPPHLKANKLLTSIAWRLSSVVSFITNKTPMMTKETAESSHTIVKYDNSKIRERLNYTFKPIKQTSLDFAPYFKEKYKF